MSNSNKEKRDLFFKLYLENQKKIFSYILMLVPNTSDAEDILQTASSIMWSKFDSFTEGTNFGAWGVKIAQYVVFDHSRKKRKMKTIFTGDMLHIFADAVASKINEQDKRISHLENCIKKLCEADQEIIQFRYVKGHSIKKISELIERPLQGLYKAVNRIHNQLLKCVQRVLLVEERYE